jgi:hypothetical protein
MASNGSLEPQPADQNADITRTRSSEFRQSPELCQAPDSARQGWWYRMLPPVKARSRDRSAGTERLASTKPSAATTTHSPSARTEHPSYLQPVAIASIRSKVHAYGEINRLEKNCEQPSGPVNRYGRSSLSSPVSGHKIPNCCWEYGCPGPSPRSGR